MTSATRSGAALLAGVVAALALAAMATLTARAAWPAYAAAEPHKTYSAAMLIARLAVGAGAVAGAGLVATLIARDRGRTAWWLGGAFLLLSLPEHLYRVWSAYPVWYHVTYLAYLVPVAGFAGRAIGTVASARRRAGRAGHA